jgi:hypothetical protein
MKAASHAPLAASISFCLSSFSFNKAFQVDVRLPEGLLAVKRKEDIRRGMGVNSDSRCVEWE